MKISTLAARGKKEDEVPILPRFVSDSIINLQDEKKAEIEAVDQAKLVSGKRKASPVLQPTKIAVKNKAKKASVSKTMCDLICVILYFGYILGMLGLLGLSLYNVVHYIVVYYKNGSQVQMEQMEHHNNLMMYRVNVLEKNQKILANELLKHQNIVSTGIYNLRKDVRTLKDSVKHIEEERLHGGDDRELDSDDSHDVFPNYPDTNNPTFEGSEDSDDLHYDIDEDEDEENPITSPTGGPSPFDSTSQATQSQREEYPVDDSEYYTYYTEGTPAES